MLPDLQTPAISRTMQYKKITKPLLERKRRARINKCLDELKDLMMGALEADGENVSKLEKADILELTVRHLQRIHQPRDALEDAQKFQAGFGQCATEACKFLLAIPGVDSRVSQNLFKHLGACISACPLQIQAPNLSASVSPTPSSPSPPYCVPALKHSPKGCLKDTNSSMDDSEGGGVHGGAKGVLRNVILERRKMARLSPERMEDESENEIDVVRVEDNRNEDEMWRPW